MKYTEIEDRTLYHGTSILAALEIIKSNTLRDDLGSDNFHSGVSFTYDGKYEAKKFAKQSEEFASEDFYDSDEPISLSNGVIFAIKQSILEEQCGLKKVEWDGSTTEQEMRTFGPVTNIKSISTIAVCPIGLEIYKKELVGDPLEKLLPELESIATHKLSPFEY